MKSTDFHCLVRLCEVYRAIDLILFYVALDRQLIVNTVTKNEMPIVCIVYVSASPVE